LIPPLDVAGLSSAMGSPRWQNAWGAFYVRYAERLIARLQFRGFRLDEAKDVTHQAMRDAMLSIHRFKGASSLETWLFAIAINLIRQEQRRYSTSKTETFTDLESTWRESGLESQEAVVGTDDVEAALLDAIQRSDDLGSVLAVAKTVLRPDNYAHLVDYFLGERDHAELGHAYGITSRSSAVKLHRSLRTLREALAVVNSK
jgi:RNA polymerase sigma factor (sigma-70 family)